MYVPEHFMPGEAAVRELLSNHGASDLITMTPQGLQATLLPFEFDPDTGEHGALIGHMARGNDQWRQSVQGEAMVIVRGAEAYVTPSWYATKEEHHRVVPTWNYMIAHVYGQLVVHDDPAWIEAQIRRLTDRHETGYAEPWSVDQAPAKFIERQLRAVVGVEVVISRIEAKFKLSQNQPQENIEGVIAGLEARGQGDDSAVAAAVRTHNPHASAC
ncbi:FMN-binding negative transcriptional regulator [Streptomyces sp. PSKA54]|uniref:FMN-binding negative transcriptional regulator n=1 Tax=Streptomyces himalayensis subsp. aureolus TaxID=2758039 RepID=A0A7W2D7W8_9ACTN|nr:FMN-binding negative transcriptional regulator [Streptomyces himalayensis]MBA4866095.1 FMN-binding negative transcriptional regulator [Streptomyces himalayensis subsp. aureolus]